MIATNPRKMNAQMLVPIALGLSWPHRLTDVDVPCDWSLAQSWEFHPLDDDAFPAVRLARRVGEAGGTFPAVYNAANEVCVDAFVAGELDFLGIVDTVGAVLAEHLDDPDVAHADLTLDLVLEADTRARDRARALVEEAPMRSNTVTAPGGTRA